MLFTCEAQVKCLWVRSHRGSADATFNVLKIMGVAFLRLTSKQRTVMVTSPAGVPHRRHSEKWRAGTRTGLYDKRTLLAVTTALNIKKWIWRFQWVWGVCGPENPQLLSHRLKEPTDVALHQTLIPTGSDGRGSWGRTSKLDYSSEGALAPDVSHCSEHAHYL